MIRVSALNKRLKKTQQTQQNVTKIYTSFTICLTI